MTELLSHNHNALLFFSALLLSLFLMPAVVRLSFRIGAVDSPGDRKVHGRAVSRLGGLAMVAGVAVPLLLFQEPDRVLYGFLAGLLIVSLTGFLDDVFRISPYAKFFGEAAAAAAFLLIGGVSLEEFGDFLAIGEIRTGVLAPYLTIFCMVGVMNALNLSDGLDGLAGGIAAIACMFLAIFAWQGRDWISMSILVALLGSLFGFLRYNTYPARLFMGDTGSLLLGFSLSSVSVLLVRNGGTGAHVAPITVAAVLALPILDTLLVMARRIRHGGNPFHPDRTHLHHRLLALGLPHSAVVPILYILMAGFGIAAWSHRSLPEWIQFAYPVSMAAMVYGAVYVVGRSGARWTKGQDGEEGPLPVDPHRLLARLLGKSVRIVGWLLPLGLFVPAVLLGAVPRPMGAVALTAGAFIAVLFPWTTRKSRSSISHGLMYAACAALLLILQVAPGAPVWMPAYLASLSALVLFWVLLKMRYRGHREILPVSSFEVLLISVSLVAAFILVPAFGLGEGFRRVTLVVALESVSFLLALKILLHRRPHRNRVIAGLLLFLLAFVGAKGLLAKSDTVFLSRAPAAVSPAADAAPPVPGSRSLQPVGFRP